MTDLTLQAPPEFDAALIAKYDRSGPRYTSYPTADRFVAAFDAESYRQQLAVRRLGGNERPWSLYVHLPFCDTVCYYCGCNKVVTRNRHRATRYVDDLLAEAELHAALLGEDRRVEQMHWGGGTPTFLTDADLTRLAEGLKARIDLRPGAELAVEVDPRTVDASRMALLAALGFNRISVGVQDFDPDVQRAVNRVQGVPETLAVIDAARASGFASVNIDLIYGLPKQTPFGFRRTLEHVLAARPDRIALYGYAHLPERFKPQRHIDPQALPDPSARLQIFALAIRRLTEAGYLYIGMDHFALPGDELAVAQRQGRLQRNFQGYSTRADCDLLALGASGIGAVGASYYQNEPRVADYHDAILRGDLPICRGIELSADDLVRRSVIHALMCHATVSMQAVEIAHLIDFPHYFAEELAALAGFEEDRLVAISDGWITITRRGRLLTRAVCMVFDRYLRQREQRARYSRVI